MKNWAIVYDKFLPRHNCKTHQLLLEGCANYDDRDDTEDLLQPDNPLHAITRWPTSNPMWILANFEIYKMMVLFDSAPHTTY